MKKLKCTLALLVIAALVGCDSRIDAVNQEMANIRSLPPKAIEPMPEFNTVTVFQYSAQQLRSPLLPNSLANELKLMSGKRVYPNFSRPKQPLEHFALESLSFKGSLKGNRGQIIALIHSPDGEIEKVQRGSYMGVNQGRITNITPTRIDLLEIVPDGREGFIERPRGLVLLGPVD